jgi:DNA-binding XRE family transcriptional regulator
MAKRLKMKKTSNIEFGHKLRARRLEMGFKKQEDLGAKVGANRVTVSRWESGATGINDEYKDALKTALKVDDSFFEDNKLQLAQAKADLYQERLKNYTLLTEGIDEDLLHALSKASPGQLSDIRKILKLGKQNSKKKFA